MLLIRILNMCHPSVPNGILLRSNLEWIFLNPKPHATGGAPDRFYPFYPGTCIGVCQCQLRLFVENSRALPGCPGVTLLGESNVLPKSEY